MQVIKAGESRGLSCNAGTETSMVQLIKQVAATIPNMNFVLPLVCGLHYMFSYARAGDSEPSCSKPQVER